METIIVETALGAIKGEQSDGLHIFRGIPYAEPLQGLGRIRKPVPVAAWSGVKEALAFGSSAPQEEIPMMGTGPKGDDCLSLNIWAPEQAAGLPVMVWIHGGGFATGSSRQPLYEASRLARENGVVMVSVNYRLGILGFGYWAELPELAGDSNVGLRDQLLALRWVRDHIAGFGGNPGNITVFGESAGGMSIACLLASPQAQGLFHKAIIQSGSGDHVLLPEQAARMAAVFAGAAGDVRTCLEGELAGIVKAQRACFRALVERGEHHEPVPQFGMTLMPVLGDDVLPQHPEKALAAGASRDIPLIVGTNTEEWNLFYHAPQMLGLARKPVEDDIARQLHEFERALPGRGQSMRDAYLALLPPDTSRDDVFCAFESDRMFTIPSTRLLEARAGQGPSWFYRFDWPCPLMKALKSCHVMEVPFVFGITGEPTGQFFTGGGEGAAQLSAQVRAAWSAFARDGVPAAGGLPAWPAHETNARSALYIAAQSKVVHDYERERRLLWADHL